MIGEKITTIKKYGHEFYCVENIDELVRCGCIIADGNPNDEYATKYRGIFVKDNFLLYRLVLKGDNYRGSTYSEDGYVLAWADMQGELIMPAPSFVPLHEKQQNNDNAR